VLVTRAERAALTAAVARLLALIETGDLEATPEQVAWLRGYLAGLNTPLLEPDRAQ
jgi:hypothetical protein